MVWLGLNREKSDASASGVRRPASGGTAIRRMASVGAQLRREFTRFPFSVSLRGAAIRLDHAAESFPADNVFKPNRLPLGFRSLVAGRSVVSIRVRTGFIVMLDELRDEMVEMIPAEGNEMVEAFSLDRLYKSLDPGIQVGRANGQLFALNSCLFQGCPELGRELCVPIVDQLSRSMLAILELLDELPGSLGHPGGVRMSGGLGDNDFSGFQVHEGQNEEVHDAPGGDRSLGKEIAGPKCLGMGLEIVVPGPSASLWARLDIFLLQDVLDRLPADSRNAKAAKFAENLGVAKPGLTGDLEHQLAKRLTFAMRLSDCRFTPLNLPSPTIGSARGHDRDQFGDGRAKRQSKLGQSLALFGAGVNLARNPRAQDLVFFFEVADLAAELRVGCTGDQGQQWMKKFGHGTAVVYALSG